MLPGGSTERPSKNRPAQWEVVPQHFAASERGLANLSMGHGAAGSETDRYNPPGQSAISAYRARQ